MDQENDRRLQPEWERPGAVPSPSPDKKPWQEPKLAYVEPKLTKQGKLEEVTGQGFFGGFSP
jgi:hypothetical protein